MFNVPLLINEQESCLQGHDNCYICRSQFNGFTHGFARNNVKNLNLSRQLIPICNHFMITGLLSRLDRCYMLSQNIIWESIPVAGVKESIPAMFVTASLMGFTYCFGTNNVKTPSEFNKIYDLCGLAIQAWKTKAADCRGHGFDSWHAKSRNRTFCYLLCSECSGIGPRVDKCILSITQGFQAYFGCFGNIQCVCLSAGDKKKKENVFLLSIVIKLGEQLPFISFDTDHDRGILIFFLYSFAQFIYPPNVYYS